jgi:hypothetical protein
VIDTCGFKKDGFFFYQSQWTDQARAAPVPALELERQGGPIHPGDLLHQLRQRGAFSERQVVRREGLRLPAPGPICT